MLLVNTLLTCCSFAVILLSSATSTWPDLQANSLATRKQATMTETKAVPIQDSPPTQHELLKLPSSLRALFVSRSSSPSPPSAVPSPPKDLPAPKLVEPRLKLSDRIKDQLNIKGSIKGLSVANYVKLSC